VGFDYINKLLLFFPIVLVEAGKANVVTSKLVLAALSFPSLSIAEIVTPYNVLIYFQN
jgi:hypothetical protein